MEAEPEVGQTSPTPDQDVSFRLFDNDSHPPSQVVDSHHRSRIQTRPIPIQTTNVYGNTTAFGNAQVLQGDIYHIYNSFSSYDGPSLQNPRGNAALQRHAVAAIFRILSSSAERNDSLWQNFEARLTEPDEAHRSRASPEGYAVDAVDADTSLGSREDELAFEDVFDDATEARPAPRTRQLSQGQRSDIAREEQADDGTRTPGPVSPRPNFRLRRPLPDIGADDREGEPELAFRNPNTQSAAISQVENLPVPKSGIQHFVTSQDIIEVGSWFQDLAPRTDMNHHDDVNWPTSHFTQWLVHGTPWHPQGCSGGFPTESIQVDHRRIRLGLILAQLHSVLSLPRSEPSTETPMMGLVLTHTWLWEPSMMTKTPESDLGRFEDMSRTCELIAKLNRTKLEAQLAV